MRKFYLLLQDDSLSINRSLIGNGIVGTGAKAKNNRSVKMDNKLVIALNSYNTKVQASGGKHPHRFGKSLTYCCILSSS